MTKKMKGTKELRLKVKFDSFYLILEQWNTYFNKNNFLNHIGIL